ncbi:MAG: M3 family oligoendopeptidase [Merismopedia sp. SIO2A8]|nr:M3 family oligoendopeptidase [Merismopedia sp. SIO2A8]
MPQFRQTWDNSHFFKGSDDPQIKIAMVQLKQDISELRDRCSRFLEQADLSEHFDHDITSPEITTLIETIRGLHNQRTVIRHALGNLRVFISSTLSGNSQDANATSCFPTLQQLAAELAQAIKPLEVFLIRAPQPLINHVLAQPDLAELSFFLTHARKLKAHLLSVQEETLLAGLAVNGLHSWGNLYDELAGSLTCNITSVAIPAEKRLESDGTEPLGEQETNGTQHQLVRHHETIGLAKAATLLSDPNRSLRAAAWHGIQSAWDSRKETVATILNSINGWRLEEFKQRSYQQDFHYLDKSCHESAIERQTLDTLLETTYAHRSIGQRALKAMGRVLNTQQVEPWDLLAPAPIMGDSDRITFDAAIEIVADAFSQLTPAMGEFAMMMAEKGWIDAKPTPNRTTGAYCTGFSNPREPRIFLTFDGTMTNVMTLAHELGHAWHNWVMRDLPWAESNYPMTLAETASIFAETLVRDTLLTKATNPVQRLEVSWQDAQSAASFLLNIPARFEFEQRLVEARKQEFVIADTLKTMMADSWQLWYEDSLAQYDELFWASKLHFSISEIGFYNYPYLFGYLFSLGLYSQREQYGDAFNERYTALLRDTGRMTAEDLVAHHLQQDIRQPEFWVNSLSIVDQAVSQFEQLANDLMQKVA